MDERQGNNLIRLVYDDFDLRGPRSNGLRWFEFGEQFFEKWGVLFGVEVVLAKHP
jgi:hypothetical protein